MPAAADDFAIMRFSTDALPERERIALWRDFYAPLVARFDMEPLSEGPLTFEATARVTPDLTVARTTSSPVRLERTGNLLAGGNDRVSLAVAVSGGGWLSHLGREFARAPGSAYLCSHADPVKAVFGEGISRFITVSIPGKALTTTVPQPEDRFMRRISPGSEALRLLTSYVGLMEEDHTFANADLRRLVVTHVHDLVALALGASRDAAEIASWRGLRAARLHAVKADIRASLTEQGLSLTAVAARRGVMPRYVQALFEGDGTTFSQFLLGERLARVHRMLRDPLQMTRGVSTIAYEAGFGDLSHFNRAFRRRYGATPSDVRAAANQERSG